LIVKLGGWSKNPMVSGLCERLTALDGVSKKTTPQRCFIKLKGDTLATLGVEGGRPVVEFRTREKDYSEAHSSSFVIPHPQGAMARNGWLQSRPASQAEADSIFRWIAAASSEKQA
jgi:hypothetical protein